MEIWKCREGWGYKSPQKKKKNDIWAKTWSSWGSELYGYLGGDHSSQRIKCRRPGRVVEQQGGQCGWNEMSQEEARRKRVQRGKRGVDGRVSFTERSGSYWKDLTEQWDKMSL